MKVTQSQRKVLARLADGDILRQCLMGYEYLHGGGFIKKSTHESLVLAGLIHSLRANDKYNWEITPKGRELIK